LPREFIESHADRFEKTPHFRALLGEPAIRSAILNDPVTLPHHDDREGYWPNNPLGYWLSGASDLREIQRYVPAEAFAHILDFGGASGRMARHFTLLDNVRSVTIAELSPSHVSWVDAHFGPKVRPVKVCPQPHFPLADSSMTCCVGMSVFTHIDACETGWLAEINRVLVDGGWAFLTIHCERAWARMRETPLGALVGDEKFEALRASESMPEERMVFNYKPGTRYHCCNTFARPEYIRRSWGRWFEVVGIYDLTHHFQSAVVLRKAGGSRG
jgi:SAM-dependent methyltransferase